MAISLNETWQDILPQIGCILFSDKPPLNWSEQKSCLCAAAFWPRSQRCDLDWSTLLGQRCQATAGLRDPLRAHGRGRFFFFFRWYRTLAKCSWVMGVSQFIIHNWFLSTGKPWKPNCLGYPYFGTSPYLYIVSSLNWTKSPDTKWPSCEITDADHFSSSEDCQLPWI